MAAPGAGFGQTITVVNQSGKVVSTSKQLLSVFKEAKSAYRERKAEIVADRRAKAGLPPQQSQMRAIERGMEVHTITDDSYSESTARPLPNRTKSHAHRPSNHHRRRSSSSSVHTHSTATSSIYPSSNHRFASGDLDISNHRSAPVSPSRSPPREGLNRAHTTQELAILPPRPASNLTRSNTTPVDMDLAYGEYHPSSLTALDRAPPSPADETELKSLVTKARMLLDEANCAQHSVTAIIKHLQSNPEAMAAVALTLAEISNIAGKMAPGALGALKGTAPAVFALLASPQFMIAAGVGVGITIVALGGYKIIKRIKARKEGEAEGVDEMMEIGGDINHIDSWRKGIADAEMESLGTSVDGEFITPEAARQSGFFEPVPEPSRVRDLKGSRSVKSSKSKTKPKSRFSSSRSERSGSTTVGSEVSVSSSISSRGSKGDKKARGEKKKEKKDKENEKEKKPSPLRLMFR